MKTMILIQRNCFVILIILFILGADAKWPHPEPEYHKNHFRRESKGYSRIPDIEGIETTTTRTENTWRWTTVPTTVTQTTTRPTIQLNSTTERPTFTFRPTTQKTTTTDGWVATTRSTTKRPVLTEKEPVSNPSIAEQQVNKPITENIPENWYYPDYDEPETIKTCEMTCKSKPKSYELKEDSFWDILNGVYTCPMQELGKIIKNNDKYCDIFVNSIDPKANTTRYYCSHSAILSIASEKLKKSVSDVIKQHVRNQYGGRDRAPDFIWPPLPPVVVKSILEYIYTFRMTDVEAQHNIIGLYVGAFTADLTELMDLIEDYLDQTSDTVELLNQFAFYYRWAHNTSNLQLKDRLSQIGPKILKMSQEQFQNFIKNLGELKTNQ